MDALISTAKLVFVLFCVGTVLSVVVGVFMGLSGWGPRRPPTRPIRPPRSWLTEDEYREWREWEAEAKDEERYRREVQAQKRRPW